MNTLRKLSSDSRGAVLAEFVLALVPLLTMFFSFVQLSRLSAARLVVKHSAIVGARAASVLSNGKGNNPGAPADAGDVSVQNAVKSALGPWWSKPGGVTAVNVDVKDDSSKEDPSGWVEVTVRATYACNIPMGSIACGGRSRELIESFRMPHQGARYEMEE